MCSLRLGCHCFQVWPELGSMCLYLYVCAYKHLHLSFSLSLFLYIYDKMGSHWHYKLQHHRIHVIFFFLICNLPFCQWETWIPFPLISMYVCSWSPTSDFPLTPSSSHPGSENPCHAVPPTRHPPHPSWALGHCPEPPWLPPTFALPQLLALRLNWQEGSEEEVKKRVYILPLKLKKKKKE